MARSNGNGGCFVVVVLCIGLYACYHDSGSKQTAQQAALSGEATPSVIQGAAASVDPNREFDEDAARDAARDDLAGVTYEGEHGSFDCTDDCSGHEAGWTAAQEETVECDGGAAGSFEAGCAAYEEAIEERVEQARDAYERGDGAFEE